MFHVQVRNVGDTEVVPHTSTIRRGRVSCSSSFLLVLSPALAEARPTCRSVAPARGGGATCRRLNSYFRSGGTFHQTCVHSGAGGGAENRANKRVFEGPTACRLAFGPAVFPVNGWGGGVRRAQSEVRSRSRAYAERVSTAVAPALGCRAGSGKLVRGWKVKY